MQIRVSKTMLSLLMMLLSGFIISACSAENPNSDSLQSIVDANTSQGTAIAAAATAQFFGAQLTATVEMRNQAATQQALAFQSTQQSSYIQSTERAWQATSTADSAISTTVASGTASAAAQHAAWTQRAIDITSTADAASVQAFATQQYAEARNQELALQRAEWMNGIAAIVPWGAGISSIIVGFFILLRWTRLRVIQRDQRGDAPLILNIMDGVAYDADRQPTSAGGLLRQDVKLLPKLTSGDYMQTTTRDQFMDIKTRGLPNTMHRRQIDKMPESLIATGDTPKIQVIDPSQATPLLRDVIPNIIRDAIDAEIISEHPIEGDNQ